MNDTTTTTTEEVLRLLREADDLNARALALIARGDIGADLGLSDEVAIRLLARRTSWEARELLSMTEVLSSMPATAGLLTEAVLSFSQVRGICRAVRPLGVAERAQIDALVARRAPALCDAEPEQIIWDTENLVFDLTPSEQNRREAQAVESSFLCLQGRLDGGGSIYGQADTASFATLCQAIDLASPRPVKSEGPYDRTRGRQMFDGLLSICQDSLQGGGTAQATSTGTGTRPRPLFVLTAQVDEHGLAGAARVLGNVTGRPQRLSPLATEVAACDATYKAVVFDGEVPIAIGRQTQTIPERLRLAVAARDGGCRGPGCFAPMRWCDLHHLIPREDGGPTEEWNLGGFCRRCHTKAHEQGWKITPEPGGVMAIQIKGRTYRTHSRVRPPPRN